MPRFSVKNLQNYVESKQQSNLALDVRNPVERISNWVKEREDQGTIDFTRFATAEFGRNMFRTSLNRFYSRFFKRWSNKLKNNLTKEYHNYSSGGFAASNVGLRGFNIEDLRPQFKDQLKQQISFNLSLIKDRTESDMLKLENRFMNWVNMRNMGNDATALSKAIGFSKENKKIARHMRLLLKDQTMKLSSSFDEITARHYGAICFIWNTRKDNKVSGNPAGLNPNADDKSRYHGNHYKRQGKVYFYDESWAMKKGYINKSKVNLVSSLKDGMPGKPINCRCYAKNIYNLEDVKVEFLSKRGRQYIETI